MRGTAFFRNLGVALSPSGSQTGSIHVTSNIQSDTGKIIGDEAVNQNPAAGGATTITNGSTIATTNGAQRITSTADVTGIILAAGTIGGQLVTVINTGSHQITFAASGTSNVASGTSAFILANTASSFIWDSVEALWYVAGGAGLPTPFTVAEGGTGQTDGHNLSWGNPIYMTRINS